MAQNGVEVHRPNKFQPQKFSPGKFSSYAMEAKHNVDTLANRTHPVQKTTSFMPNIPSRPSGGTARQPQKPRNTANSSSNNTPVPSNKTIGGAFGKFNTKPARQQD
jgi:hypothetical protein